MDVPGARVSGSRDIVVSLAIYAIVTLWVGRAVFVNLAHGVVNDIGDPLLNAAILGWNAQSVPWTDAWYDFPIFYPTTEALTFSEHLLGLWPIATPLYWLTGNLLATYNVVVLLSFPLCAISMFLLVRRLTDSAGGAFAAGVAYGFAPYRIAQISHVQILAVFWMPLAILALHEYAASQRRKWLVLFAITFALQGATNGYYLVLFSVFVGLWVVWFLAFQGLWRQLAAVVGAWVAAITPLIPILVHYISTHRAQGFQRGLGEVRAFSADIGGVLCAAPTLSVWGELRVGCKPEGELFPGVALVVTVVVAALTFRWPVTHDTPPRTRVVSIIRRLLVAMGMVYGVIVLAVWWSGGLQLHLGPFTASASSIRKPLSVVLVCVLGLAATGGRLREAAGRSSTIGFYAVSGAVMWLLALGPEPTLFGEPLLYEAPYAWLMYVPGVDGLRVPSRAWMLTILSLSVLAGFAVTQATRQRSRRDARWILAVASAGLFLDGWATLRMADVRQIIPDQAGLKGRTVVELPLGDLGDDTLATYYAVAGGWRSVNGYSGYAPHYYQALKASSATADDVLLDLLQQQTSVSVVVRTDHPMLAQMLNSRPDAVERSRNDAAVQYDLPRRTTSDRSDVLGPKVSIARVTTSDGAITADLARPAFVGALVEPLGPNLGDLPGQATVETSMDGAVWEPAWHNGVLAPVFEAAIADPRAMRLTFRFPPRQARFVRLRVTAPNTRYLESASNIEVRAAPPR